MISNQRTKPAKIGSTIIILLAIALMPLASMGDALAQEETPQLAPRNPDFLEFWKQPPPEPFYGYIPPPMDLSHLNEIPVEGARGLATLPTSFDWRATGKVTSVKNQNPCGTCWLFGTLAAVESKVLIDESVAPEPDYSEQNLGCCTDPSWVYLIGNRCMGGGWSWLATDTLSKKGTRLEACDPYDTGTINTEACDDTCETIKRVTDYRMVADPATSPGVVEPIKNAIYSHGPVSMALHAEGEPWSHMYPGYIYYWPDCPAGANHLVSIVGWDNGIPWPDDSGSGAWIVKNSWGTGWGDSGYFYLCYGSASMCEVASYRYKDYNSNEQIYYWDEAGIVGSLGNWADYTGWMANIFSSSQDGSLTHVDFWTTSNSAEYEIYVYRDGDISDGLQDLATSQSNTCAEFGYYSMALDNPVSLTNGEAFTIAVRMITPGYKYPIPVEYKADTIVDPPIQNGVSFFRHGDGDPWFDGATVNSGCNICLRGRVTTGVEGQPDITVSHTSIVESGPPDTTWTWAEVLTIGNIGDVTLYYSISDEETAGAGSTAGGEDSLSGPGSMVLEIPLESSPVKPLNTPEAGSGWQNIVTDGFEGAFPGVWNVFGTGAADAYWGKDDYNPYSGSYSAFCAKSGTAGVNPPSDYPNDMTAWMVYGPFSLADATDAELNFYYWLDSEYEWDYLWCVASIEETNWYGWWYTGDFGDWVSESFDLTNVHTLGNLCGQSQVWIAFIFTSDEIYTDKGAFIDDVVLRKYVAAINNPPNPPNDPLPENHATGVSIPVTLSVLASDPDGDAMTVTFRNASDDSVIGTPQTGVASGSRAEVIWSELDPDTTYSWYAKANDGEFDSLQSDTWDFTTGVPEDCPWLDEDPKSGSVPPGGHADITITFDTTGLSSTYTANIIISSNDPVEPQVIVPVTLNVGVASVSIDPDSQMVPPGGSSSVDVVVDSATYKLMSCHVEVSYDPAIFTDVTVEEKGLLGTLILEEPGSGVFDGLVTHGVTRQAGNEAEPVSGLFITISFTVSATAPLDNTYYLGVHNSLLLDETMTDIPGVVENDGQVTIGGRKGDFDGDGDIDFYDFAAFGLCYDATSCEDPRYNPIGDFDDDCDIDFYDFAAFGLVYET